MKNQVCFTDGPWVIDKVNWSNKLLTIVIADKDDRTLCVVPSNDVGDEVAFSNAKLIAYAPRLYAHIEAMAKMIEFLDNSHWDYVGEHHPKCGTCAYLNRVRIDMDMIRLSTPTAMGER